VVHLVVLDRLLRATTKKKVVNFFEEKKCTPRQNPAYVYALQSSSTMSIYLTSSSAIAETPRCYGQKWKTGTGRQCLQT